MNQRTAAVGGPLATRYDRLKVDQLRRRPGAKWQVPPSDVLPAWVADMDFPVAEPIRRRLRELADGDLGYPDWPDNVTPLRPVFADRMDRRYGWRPDPAQVREFTDVTQVVQAVLHLMTEPGDGVAVHTPVFRPFLRAIESMGRRPVPIPMLDTEHGWVFDVGQFAADVARSGCRVLLLVNPHNPTGRVFRRDELAALAEVAERHDLVVVSDEIHADLTYAPHEHIPFATLGQAIEERTVTVTSASKAFNLAGARCAVAHLGHAGVRKAVAALPSNLMGTISVPALHATIAAWTDADEWLAETVSYLDGNSRMVAAAVAAELPGIRHHRPEATYLAWLDCTALGLPDDPAAVFRDIGRVELSPGPDFNPGGVGFARLNFATSRSLVRTLLDRIVLTTHLLEASC
jgi:cystathionine beta-lyase